MHYVDDNLQASAKFLVQEIINRIKTRCWYINDFFQSFVGESLIMVKGMLYSRLFSYFYNFCIKALL